MILFLFVLDFFLGQPFFLCLYKEKKSEIHKFPFLFVLVQKKIGKSKPSGFSKSACLWVARIYLLSLPPISPLLFLFIREKRINASCAREIGYKRKRERLAKLLSLHFSFFKKIISVMDIDKTVLSHKNKNRF